MNQINSTSPARHRVGSNRQECHRCPYCSKQYKVPTWLENHIKIKHSARDAQEQPEISTVVGIVRQHEPSQGPHVAALVDGLRDISSLLDQFIPLINDVAPLLQELKEGSSKRDQGYLQNLKRRASSPDLHEGEGIKRKNVSMHSPKLNPSQQSGSICGNMPENWTNSPITPSADDKSLTTNELNHSFGFARHSFPRNSQKSRLPPSQGNMLYSPILDSELLQQQLQTTLFQVPGLRKQAENTTSTEQPTQYQHKRSPLGRKSAWTPLATSKPVIDAQLLQSLQESNQHQSMMQTMRHLSGSSLFAFQDTNDFGRTFQDCGVLDPLISDSTNEFRFPGQPVESSKGGDDLLFDVFDA